MMFTKGALPVSTCLDSSDSSLPPTSPAQAWCGDTRALLLHGRKVVPLSEDHVPKRPVESAKQPSRFPGDGLNALLGVSEQETFVQRAYTDHASTGGSERTIKNT